MEIHFDLEFFLTLSTLFTGLTAFIFYVPWLRVRLFSPLGSVYKTFIEICVSLFPVLLIVLLIRSFIVEPFRIPSGSMLPTLEVGDFILVNKFTYGLKLPVFGCQILQNDKPQRGDVVVFRHPVETDKDYIKRIIGLPGDFVEYIDKRLIINGEEIPVEYIGTYKVAQRGSIYYDYLQEREFFDEEGHDIMEIRQIRPRNFSWQIPPEQYLMMGDNRDNSSDSRVWGLVPEKLIVGKAFMIWMHWNFDDGGMDFSRIGVGIR